MYCDNRYLALTIHPKYVYADLRVHIDLPIFKNRVSMSFAKTGASFLKNDGSIRARVLSLKLPGST